MTETPRTDKAAKNFDSGTIEGEYVEAEFARELERELYNSRCLARIDLLTEKTRHAQGKRKQDLERRLKRVMWRFLDRNP